MRIELRKKITLHSATVYMKILKNILREDIQDYLNGKRFQNPLVNNRIDEYLKEIRVYDGNKSLTKKGEELKECGILPTYEEGKYKIYYTEDDYLGKRIIYFRREAPSSFFKERIEDNFEFEKGGHFLLPVGNEKTDTMPFSLWSKKGEEKSNLQGSLENGSDELDFSVFLESPKSVYYSFSGKIENKELCENKIIHREEKYEDLITKIFPNFDTQYNRLKVKFKPQHKKFSGSLSNYEWENFSVNVDSINLMPSDKGEAVKWRDYLLREEVSKSYFSKNDFENMAAQINENKGFEKYKNNLDIPSIENLKTETKTEFWHLNAPMDLNPNNLFSGSNEIITLKKDEEISFSGILKKLGISSGNEFAIYYDQYVRTEYQQKKAVSLLQSLSANKSIVITDLQNMKSNFLIQAEIALQDSKKGIFTGRPLHDRYLIVKDNRNTKFWCISNSLDFLKFQENEILSDTLGTVVNSVTFTPLQEKDMDKELLKFVKGV